MLEVMSVPYLKSKKRLANILSIDKLSKRKRPDSNRQPSAYWSMDINPEPKTDALAIAPRFPSRKVG